MDVVSFQASPLRKASGIVVGASHAVQFTAVVLPKPWRSAEKSEIVEVTWPEKGKECEDSTAFSVRLFEGDYCRIKLPGQDREDAKAAINAAILQCEIRAREDESEDEGEDENEHENKDENYKTSTAHEADKKPDPLLKLVAGTPPPTDKGGHDNVDHVHAGIDTMLSLLERCNKSRVAAHSSASFDSEPGSLHLLRPLLHRRFLDEIGLHIHDIRRGYVPEQAELAAVRGRIVSRGLMRQAATKSPRILCRFENFTEETPLFRILVTALRCVAAEGRPRPPFDGTDAFRYLSDDAAGFCRHFADIRPLQQATALHEARRLLLPRTLARWEIALELARLVIGEREMPPRADGNEHTAAIMVRVNTDKLWENILQQALERHDDTENISSQSRTVSPWTKLGSAKLPDLLVRVKTDETTEPCAAQFWCIDAKYKPYKSSPSPADQYQIYAYSHLAKDGNDTPSRLALVYLDFDDTNKNGAIAMGKSYPRAGEEDVWLDNIAVPFPRVCMVGSEMKWNEYLDQTGKRIMNRMSAAKLSASVHNGANQINQGSFPPVQASGKSDDSRQPAGPVERHSDND